MLVDTSAYVGNWPFWPVPHMDSEGDGLVELMDRAGISQALVTSMDAILYDDEMGNEMALAAAARHPGRLIPAAAVSPLIIQRDSAAYLEKMVRRGMKALKLFPFYHSFQLAPSNRRLDSMLRIAQELGLTVCIPLRLFMNWGLPAVPVAAIREMVNAYPGVHFLAENLNAGEFLPLVELAEEKNNLWLGTASLTRYRGVHDMVKRITSDKVVAGMSIPMQYPECGISKIVHSEIGDEALSKVLGRTAASLFNLEEVAG